MPKRMHCPKCDRLFSRDDMDQHVSRCRGRPEAAKPARKQPHSRTVIVDGNNVAHYLEQNGMPMLSNLIMARRSLVAAGYEPVIVVSAALIHSIDRPTDLMEMVSSGQVVQVMKGQNDDREIIGLAKKMRARIVSNDRFLNWLDSNPWLPDYLMKYRMTPSGLILE